MALVAEFPSCVAHHVKGYIYKMTNKRVRVGFCEHCKFWTIATKRLPTAAERAQGERIIKTGIQYSEEAMDIVWSIMAKVSKEQENGNTGA